MRTLALYYMNREVSASFFASRKRYIFASRKLIVTDTHIYNTYFSRVEGKISRENISCRFANLLARSRWTELNRERAIAKHNMILLITKRILSGYKFRWPIIILARDGCTIDAANVKCANLLSPSIHAFCHANRIANGPRAKTLINKDNSCSLTLLCSSSLQSARIRCCWFCLWLVVVVVPPRSTSLPIELIIFLSPANRKKKKKIKVTILPEIRRFLRQRKRRKRSSEEVAYFWQFRNEREDIRGRNYRNCWYS